MAPAIAELPVSRIVEPADQAEVAETLRAAFADDVATYALGGRTSLNYGLPARANGQGLSTKRLDRTVDYPARDLTVTVEAGVTIASLAATLAAENQELPLDAPQAAEATVGGVVATNWNGPRRFGCGTVRDHVIGIHAVDGRGVPFKGGGRVVKNVAGYDFCKLLTGSCGALAVVTQVTFKLRPIAERSLLGMARCRDLPHAERVLAGFATGDAQPVALELLAGPAWRDEAGADGGSCAVLARFDGVHAEVAWLRERFATEMRAAEATDVEFADRSGADAERYGALWRRVVEFSAADAAAPLVVRANVTPGGTTAFCAAVRRVDPQASLLAHAGNGIVFARFSRFPEGGLSRSLIAVLQPAAAAAHGKVIVLSNPSGAEATRQSYWSSLGAAGDVMAAVKRQFDPKQLLNPGRFVFA